MGKGVKVRVTQKDTLVSLSTLAPGDAFTQPAPNEAHVGLVPHSAAFPSPAGNVVVIWFDRQTDKIHLSFTREDLMVRPLDGVDVAFS